MPGYDFNSPRLFVEAPLAQAGPIEATAGQANYCLNVLRMGDGDHVLAFNGRDGEWRCALKRSGKKRLDFVPEDQTRQQTAPSRLVYCFAPLKTGRLEYMIQKATEMGAGVLQPVLTHHTQSHRMRIDKMEAHAVEAAEQCGILTIPECRAPLKFDAFLEGWPSDSPLIFCDERLDETSATDVLARIPRGPVGILVGPEGGFSPGEREALNAASFATAISLGPRILRADTAAVAALALVQAICGDWTSKS